MEMGFIWPSHCQKCSGWGINSLFLVVGAVLERGGAVTERKTHPEWVSWEDLERPSVHYPCRNMAEWMQTNTRRILSKEKPQIYENYNWLMVKSDSVVGVCEYECVCICVHVCVYECICV